MASPAIKYDVFLSFRGEDTRYTFASYLYEGLCKAGIHTFMDNELQKGEHISKVLLRTIEESEISMIIFSENYASSTWCLDELVYILECKEKFGRVVIPIFYNIDPSNIRKQNGSFGNGFDKLKRRFEDNQEKSQKWINALGKAANLSGWDSKNTRPESKFVEEIVKDALSKLKYESSCHLEGLIGIARHIRNIENLLTEACIVGIWGMGGAGKITLAKAIFQELRAQFDTFSFIESVRKELKSIGLDKLRQNCLKEVLRDEDISIYDIESPSVKKRLGCKKILIILDDVDNESIGGDLTKVLYWCGEGSRIIITSRDKQVLKNASASIIYHVPRLDPHQAFHLLSLKAFKQNEPSKSHLELSKWVVDYCEGNPLALIVLGCFLHGRGKEEWESALKKLNQTLHEKIFNVLKLSFDGLDDEQKKLFLDLAFFLNEAWMISLEDCTRCLNDSSALIDISVLTEKSLISVSEYGSIGMHSLLMEMGLEISRPQSISNPEKPIRLWRHQDIYDVFNNDKRIEVIRCMSLDASQIKSTTLRASYFRKMRDLIFLEVYKSKRKGPSKLDICEDLDYVSEELRFFSWEEYPLSYVPLHFCAENLVTLEMPNSNIQQIFDGNQHFPNLEVIDLSNSKHLIALPELPHAPKLEYLVLGGCVNLAQIRSTEPVKDAYFTIQGSRGVQMNIGGSVEGTSSGLVIVRNYLNLYNWSFNKMTTKLFVSGKNIFSVRVKHVVIPLGKKKKPELEVWLRSLGSLLPFVGQVEWLESPVEFGDDFNQHCTYDYRATEAWDREEDDEWDDEEDDELIMEYCCCNTATSMEVEEEEDDDELIMEYCCSNSADIFTRVPNSVTRWSLLRQLKLKESVIIGKAGSTIAQVSILKSLVKHSHDICRRIKPRLDVIHSFDSPTSASRGGYFVVSYGVEWSQQRGCYMITNELALVYKGGTLWVETEAWTPPSRQYFTISFSRKG